MGTETEIKIRISDSRNFCRNLKRLNCRPLAGRHFEDNFLVDFQDGRLRANQCMVRLRITDRPAGGRGLLTFKGPPRPEGIFKIREELETRVEDAQATLQILERLGMRIWFRYQKYRREFEVDEVKVACDETPIGDFAEFEGSETAILDLARKMRIEPSQFLRASYYSLYVEHCERGGETPDLMTF